MDTVAGILTGEAPRDPGQGAGTAVAAASGAGDVIPLQLVQYINLNTILDGDTGFNVFFLPAAGWDFMPPYGRFFFVFCPEKENGKIKRFLLLSSRRFLPSTTLKWAC
jgi:hypothetical protein